MCVYKNALFQYDSLSNLIQIIIFFIVESELVYFHGQYLIVSLASTENSQCYTFPHTHILAVRVGKEAALALPE